MNDRMNPLVQFSPFAGKLVLEKVSGQTNQTVEHENDVSAACGRDRSMYCYAPRSGCPDPKQTQVVMVLRDGEDEASAFECMRRLGLDLLAEEEHFLLLFPNPTAAGWNYSCKESQENDVDYLIRCFGALRSSELRVNGFNGMVFYIADCPEASGLLTTMAALRPLNVPAMMVSQLPTDYSIPAEALRVETAAWSSDPVVSEYLKSANGGCRTEQLEQNVTIHYGRNPEVRLLTSDLPTDAKTIRLAWDKLFSVTRRWQNDTYGAYHHRIDFTQAGFKAHVHDSSLGVNNNYPHTWYEYIPPQLRNSTEKVPLVFYFHGVNCVPLYGAEQSCWSDLADRESFIVVYPAPARNKCWNIYDVPALPSDIEFVLALIEHMKTVHPIDESRVYVSGFSMGAAMTQALASAYPEKFAAAAPCNAFLFHNYTDPAEMLPPFIRDVPAEEIGHVSFSAERAKKKKQLFDLRMPLFLNVGEIDGLMALWPTKPSDQDLRTESLRYWKRFNHLPEEPFYDPDSCTGLKADETTVLGEEGRYTLQRWYDKQQCSLPLLNLMIAARMPHAIDPIQIEYSWDYIKHFARNEDGSLRMV